MRKLETEKKEEEKNGDGEIKERKDEVEKRNKR